MAPDFRPDPQEQGQHGPPRRRPPTAVGIATPPPPPPPKPRGAGWRRPRGLGLHRTTVVSAGMTGAGIAFLLLPWFLARLVGATLVVVGLTFLALLLWVRLVAPRLKLRRRRNALRARQRALQRASRPSG